MSVKEKILANAPRSGRKPQRAMTKLECDYWPNEVPAGMIDPELPVEDPVAAQHAKNAWRPFPVDLMPDAVRDFITESAESIGKRPGKGTVAYVPTAWCPRDSRRFRSHDPI